MKRPRKRTLQTCLGCAVIALIVFAAFEGMLLHGNLEYLELKSHDLWVNLQPGDKRMSKDIVVVVIKEDEVRAMVRNIRFEMKNCWNFCGEFKRKNLWRSDWIYSATASFRPKVMTCVVSSRATRIYSLSAGWRQRTGKT